MITSAITSAIMSINAPMLAPWIFGALLFSLLCAVAAWFAERTLRVLGVATRWPWVVAIVAAVCWPLIAPMVLEPPPLAPMVTSVTAMFTASGTATAVAMAPASGWHAIRDALWSGQYDRALQWLWAIATLVLVTQTLLAIVTLRRIRRRAGVRQLDGEWVLVDDTLGPAVIGVLEPAIVVPSWLMELDRDLRAFVLRHEREHCRANDAWLVWLSVIATTVLPWNAAIWWLAHRVRLAMEIDCDARTLRGTSNRAQYGKLLLLIAQHKISTRFAPALSYSPSQLHRRIRAMNTSNPRFRMVHVVTSATAAVMALLAACSSRMAANLTSPAAGNSAATATASATAGESEAAATPVVATAGAATTRPYFDFQVTNPVTMVPGSKGPAYPDELRAAHVSGQVLIQFVVRADGTVDLSTIKILKSDDERFSQSVREALTTMRFTPANLNGTLVAQLVQQPFAFRTSGSPTATSPAVAPTAQPTSTPPDITKLRTASLRPYFDFQVTNPATMVPGSKGPTYPDELRAIQKSGQVLAQFVVRADGTVDLSTIKILKSDDEQFSQSVRDALTVVRYSPANLNGTPVSQLVQQPFMFSVPDKR